MSAPTAAPPQDNLLASPRERRKVLTGTLVGTTIEMYDFLIYAQAAGLVLAPLFLEPVEDESKVLARIIAWASIGISFLFRPLGAIVGGHVGDRYGRKMVLVFSLLGMGLATMLIGVLPTYAQAGAVAPVLLITLRICQGIFAGSEWGGAALMSVEHAPKEKRGLYGSFPQLGVPLGLFLATSASLGVLFFTGKEAYLDWGWRLVFLFSIVLVLVGYLIRRSVDESPVFQAMKEDSAERTAPLPDLFRNHWKPVIKAIFIFAGNNACGYMVIAFFPSYAINTLGMDQGNIMRATLVAAVAWTVFTLWSGILSDRFGRVQVFIVGFVLQAAWILALWPLIEAKDIWMYTIAVVVLTFPLALTYGPTSSLFAEMFPAGVRFSGASIGYAIGAIVGGAFAPMIAEILVDGTGKVWTIGIYLAAMTVPAIISLALLPRNLHERNLNHF